MRFPSVRQQGIRGWGWAVAVQREPPAPSQGPGPSPGAGQVQRREVRGAGQAARPRDGGGLLGQQDPCQDF